MRVSDAEIERTTTKGDLVITRALALDLRDAREQLKIAKAALEEIGRPRGNCCGPMMSYQCAHNKAREAQEQLK